jgi:hypothetical protein
VGQAYEALITNVNFSHSRPLQVCLSSFVKGSVSFDKIVDGETLSREGVSILQKFKAGVQVEVQLTKEGEFSLIKGG